MKIHFYSRRVTENQQALYIYMYITLWCIAYITHAYMPHYISITAFTKGFLNEDVHGGSLNMCTIGSYTYVYPIPKKNIYQAQHLLNTMLMIAESNNN